MADKPYIYSTRTFAREYFVGREDIILVLCIQCASREFIRHRDAGAHEHVSSTQDVYNERSRFE